MKELAVFTQAGKSQLDSALTREYRAKGNLFMPLYSCYSLYNTHLMN